MSNNIKKFFRRFPTVINVDIAGIHLGITRLPPKFWPVFSVFPAEKNRVLTENQANIRVSGGRGRVRLHLQESVSRFCIKMKVNMNMHTLFAIIVMVGSFCDVTGYYFSKTIKMHHQICNYNDLVEFLAPICTALHGRRYRKEVRSRVVRDTSNIISSQKEAVNFLRSSHLPRSRRSVSRDVSYYDECCSHKICTYQEVTEYCTVIPFHRL
eukprot:Seg353.17 transcript_id=Seg353.17/GoldUCD/mRNA.D3Y31 product="hypothetical protein" protein_id=Seg353.17/GoldUCD/D3Y31